MGPAIVGQVEADKAFNDPARRAQFRLQHEQGVPLIDMLEGAVPKGTVIDPQLRAAITGLSPDEVAIIRKVMIAAIDAAGTAAQAKMPVQCTITEITGPVTVTEAQGVAVVTERV